jgi:DNA-binding LytR/AlgR family response regulator
MDFKKNFRNDMKNRIIFNSRSVGIITEKKVYLLSYSEIIYIVYSDPYCMLYWYENGDKKYFSGKSSITKVKEKLPLVFFQCNQSAIINTNHVKGYDSKFIYMKDGKEFELPRRMKIDFKRHIERVQQIHCHCAECNLYEKGCEMGAIKN